MVTPNGWRRGNFKKSQHHNAQELIWSNSLLWVKDAKPHFPEVGNSILIDAWHVQKTGKPTNTGYPALDQHWLYPLDRSPIVLSTLSKFFDACNVKELVKFGWDYHDNRITQNTQDETYRYRYAGTLAKLKKGVQLWSSREPKSYHDEKVIFADCGKVEAVISEEPMGACMHFLASGVAASRLAAFLNGPLPSWVLNNFSIEGALRIPVEMIYKLPYAVLTSDDPLREVFGLSPAEIELVEKETR